MENKASGNSQHDGHINFIHTFIWYSVATKRKRKWEKLTQGKPQPENQAEWESNSGLGCRGSNSM